MPVVVDSDERRTAVVSAAAELIVEGGLNAVTFRNIAARLGFSTTVISHYFRDKTDVLRATYQHVVAEAVMHREQVLAGQNASPVRVLEEVLPVADTQRRIWTVWLCFWTAALFDKTLLEEHRRGLAGTRERLRLHFLAEGEPAERAEQAAEDLAQERCRRCSTPPTGLRNVSVPPIGVRPSGSRPCRKPRVEPASGRVRRVLVVPLVTLSKNILQCKKCLRTDRRFRQSKKLRTISSGTRWGWSRPGTKVMRHSGWKCALGCGTIFRSRSHIATRSST